MEITGGMRSRDYSLDRARVDIEKACEGRLACRRDEELARLLYRGEPPLVLVMPQQRSAERTGDVRAALSRSRLGCASMAAVAAMRRGCMGRFSRPPRV